LNILITFFQVKRWGRYIEHPDLMYRPYNHTPNKYAIALKKYKKEDLPNGTMMTDEEFENANVDVTVSQMDIKCGYYTNLQILFCKIYTRPFKVKKKFF
jgi:hypothetical protein